MGGQRNRWVRIPGLVLRFALPRVLILWTLFWLVVLFLFAIEDGVETWGEAAAVALFGTAAIIVFYDGLLRRAAGGFATVTAISVATAVGIAVALAEGGVSDADASGLLVVAGPGILGGFLKHAFTPGRPSPPARPGTV